VSLLFSLHPFGKATDTTDATDSGSTWRIPCRMSLGKLFADVHSLRRAATYHLWVSTPSLRHAFSRVQNSSTAEG
jgi:hypothetical protein